MATVGFIGLGIMGAPMAANLLKKGRQLMVNDKVRPNVDKLVAQGATSATPREIGNSCDLVFTILPNGSIVKDVLFGADGLAAHLKEGAVVVDMSSVTPVESTFCHGELKKRGVGFLDAPVSGGEPKAIDGTLAFMVGGEPSIYEEVKPLLLDMGASAVLVGGPGSGSTTKLVNQIIVNMNIATLSEALVFAKKAGVDPEKVYSAIRGGLAGSAVMDAKTPLILSRNFAPGGKISINHKDIKNVVATAHEMDIPVPMTASLFEIFQILKLRGLMDEDHGAIVKYFESLSGVTVTKGVN